MAVNTPIQHLGTGKVSIPFEIHSMEWIARNRREQNSAPHRHEFFVLVWVIRATGQHQLDLETMPLQNNTIYGIAPGQIHWLQPDAGAVGYVLSFTEAFLGPDHDARELLDRLGLSRHQSRTIIPLSEEMIPELEELVLRMTTEFENYYLLRGEILRGYLKIFLILLGRQYRVEEIAPPPGRSGELVQHFLDLVDQHYASMKKVADYADRLVVTPNHLNEAVRKATGSTASQHIQQRLILEAQRLATYTSQSMKEIAYQLGFDDSAHFSKFFRKMSGESFSDFRKQGGLGRG